MEFLSCAEVPPCASRMKMRNVVCESRAIADRDPIMSRVKRVRYRNKMHKHDARHGTRWRSRKCDLVLALQSKWQDLLHAPNQAGSVDENHRLLNSLSQFTLFLGRFFICVLCRRIDSRFAEL